MTQNSTTFWRLIGDYQVTIPMLQRDYAQGRDDPETTEIRTSFLHEFKRVLDPSEHKELHLGLVFGTMEKDSLILLDGQQRFTTLFLLHWYLARRLQTESLDSRFGKFSYETRTASRDFCRALAVENITISETSTLGKQFREQAWFRLEWMCDPTIGGMLVMLDAIHKYFPSDKAVDYWQRLTDASHPRVTFQFLEPLKNVSADELYIKLNGRGRQLTEFEKFKAWLEHHLKDDVSANEWEKLDTRWTNLFWKHRLDPESDEISGSMVAFFQGFALNFLLEAETVSGQTEFVEKLISLVRGNHFLTKVQREAFLTPGNTLKVFSLLDWLSGDEYGHLCNWMEEAEVDKFQEKAKKTSFSKRIISGWEEFSFTDRLIAHGLHCFLESVGENLNESHRIAFIRWMRVVRNLIVNSDIRSDNLGNAVRSLSQLARKGCHDIYKCLAEQNKSDTIPDAFDEFQVQEERIKAKLICGVNGKSWEIAIREAEDHSFFRGQIRFLIDFSQNGDGHDFQLFQNYAERAGKLFAPERKPLEEPFSLQRALLAKGDFMIEVGTNWSFGKDRDEWRTILQCPDHRPVIIKALLDEVATKSLSEIINESSVEPADWRYPFIQDPEILEFCTNRYIRWNENPEGVLLIQGRRLSGNHAEMRSYAVLLEIKKNVAFDNCRSNYEGYNNYESCAVIENPVNASNAWRIEIRHPLRGARSEPYEIRILRRNAIEISLFANYRGLTEAEPNPPKEWGDVKVRRLPDQKSTLDELKRLVEALSKTNVAFSAVAPTN